MVFIPFEKNDRLLCNVVTIEIVGIWVGTDPERL